MAQFVEFTTGLWLDGLDADLTREVQTLAHLLPHGVLDAVLALAMFEQACQAMQSESHRDSWERDRRLEHEREQELTAADPRDPGAPDYIEWRLRLSEQARRDVMRQKWAAGELPRELQHRLPFVHAEAFVIALAQVRRRLQELGETGVDVSGEIARACTDFDASVPALTAARDSVEQVTSNAMHAPGGRAPIGGMLNNNRFGWSVDDGGYQEVEISDATVEAARAAVQRALDSLPWRRHGYPTYLPRD
jgi:hypothetical protein